MTIGGASRDAMVSGTTIDRSRISFTPVRDTITQGRDFSISEPARIALREIRPNERRRGGASSLKIAREDRSPARRSNAKSVIFLSEARIGLEQLRRDDNLGLTLVDRAARMTRSITRLRSRPLNIAPRSARPLRNSRRLVENALGRGHGTSRSSSHLSDDTLEPRHTLSRSRIQVHVEPLTTPAALYMLPVLQTFANPLTLNVSVLAAFAPRGQGFRARSIWADGRQWVPTVGMGRRQPKSLRSKLQMEQCRISSYTAPRTRTLVRRRSLRAFSPYIAVDCERFKCLEFCCLYRVTAKAGIPLLPDLHANRENSPPTPSSSSPETPSPSRAWSSDGRARRRARRLRRPSSPPSPSRHRRRRRSSPARPAPNWSR